MLFTATAEPSATPPRVRLDLDAQNTDSTFTSIIIRRDGEVIRSVAPVGSSVSVVYDYDAVYDVPSVYTVEAQTVTTTLAWTEAWASVASWTGSGWSVTGGKATATVDESTIYRAVVGTLGKVVFADVDWATIYILDSTGTSPIMSVDVRGDHAIVSGFGAVSDPAVSVGSGAFTIVFSDGVATMSGAAYDTVSVNYGGTPNRVQLVAQPNDPAQALSFVALANGTDQFSPVDVAVTSGGDIWAVDWYGHRICRFNSAGVHQQTVGKAGGGSGTGNGEFNNPGSIAIDSSGNLWVSDYANNRIQKFNSSGVYQAKVGTLGTGNGQFDGAGGLCVDSSNNVWVTDYRNNRVQKFNSSAVYQSQFGGPGNTNGLFANPWGITRDTANNLYVMDYGNYRVQKFNSAGTYQTQWGQIGNADGFFDQALGIEADSAGNIYVADTYNNRVQKFSNVGVFLYQWDGSSNGGSPFNLPWSLAVDSSDNVYVTDTNNYTIRKFGSSQQAAFVDDVTAYLAPPAPVTIVGTDTETLAGLAAWLIHPTTPSLSVKIDNGPAGASTPICVVEETSRQMTVPASGRSVLEIEGSDTPVVVSTGPRRIPDRTLQLQTDGFTSRDTVLAALKSNDPVLLRSPAAWDLDMPQGWFSVGDVERERRDLPNLSPGKETTLTLPLTPVRTPVIETSFGRSYADELVGGGTYADAVASGRTYLQRLTG